MRSKAITWTTVPALLAALVAPARPAAQEQKNEHLHYRLIALGTFGGPISYINPVGNGGPYMNRLGSVVGSSMTFFSIPTDQNGFSCPSPPDQVFHSMLWNGDNVVDLGSLGDASNCGNALGINDDGLIVGTSENGKLDPTTGVLELRAVTWKDGHIRNLGTFGGNHSFAASINNRNQVVGFALNRVPDNFSLFAAFIGGPSAGTQTRAFLWENGRMRDLNTLGGPDAWATFVNEPGQVAGFSYTDSTPNNTTGLPTIAPFLWQHNKMMNLGTLGGSRGFPVGLNNRGQVIGQSNLAGDQSCDPFLWDGRKLIDLATSGIGGSFVCGHVNGINDDGEIVGAAAFPDNPFHAAMWRNGVMTDLGSLAGDCFSEALVISSKGQVAGGSFPCDFSAEHAFLWENGTIFDITALISPTSGALMVEPNAINESGEIAIDGLPPGCTDFNLCSQAYVLIPCDRDHSGEKECEEEVLGPIGSNNSPATIGQNPINVLENGQTPREIGARIHARFGRNRVPGAFAQK